MKYLIHLFVFLILINCSKQELDYSAHLPIQSGGLDSLQIKTIAFSKELEIYNSDLQLHQIGSLAVDNKSRLYISSGNSIQMFDVNGNYLHTFGRKGRGPGEFSNMQAIEPKLSSNRLFAYDDVLKRINVYGIKTTKFLYSIPIRPTNWNNISELKGSQFANFFVLNDSLLLGEFQDSFVFNEKDTLQSRYFQINLKGEIVSNQIFKVPKIKFYKGNGIPEPISGSLDDPFPNASTENYIIDIDSESKLYSVWTGEFLIKVYSTSGKYIRSIMFEFEKEGLDEQKIIQSYKSRGGRIYQKAREYNYPKTWPAVDQFFLDDKDRIWISTITEDDNNYEWYVLSNTGELITKFKWQGNKLKRHYQEREIKDVIDDYLYSIEIDKDTFEKKITRYRLEIK